MCQFLFRTAIAGNGATSRAAWHVVLDVAACGWRGRNEVGPSPPRRLYLAAFVRSVLPTEESWVNFRPGTRRDGAPSGTAATPMPGRRARPESAPGTGCGRRANRPGTVADRARADRR